MSQTIAIASTSTSARRFTAQRPFVSALRAGQCAQSIAEGYLQYDAAFRELTRRAPERFQERDWQGSQLDEAERIELYERHVERTAIAVRAHSGHQIEQPMFWRDALRHFSILTDGIPDAETCHTFCQSVLVEVYRTTGVACIPTFTGNHGGSRATGELAAVRRFTQRVSLDALLVQMLWAIPLEAEWHDVDVSAAQILTALEDSIQAFAAIGEIKGIELIDTVFYRFTRAYVVATVKGSHGHLILSLELRNGPAGVEIENVLIGEPAVGELFRFTGACFHVELEHPVDTAAYLQTLMPRVPTGDFLTVFGRPSNSSVALAG